MACIAIHAAVRVFESVLSGNVCKLVERKEQNTVSVRFHLLFCFTVNFWLERRTRSHSIHYYCCDRMSICRPTVTVRPFAFFISHIVLVSSHWDLWLLKFDQSRTQSRREKDLYVFQQRCVPMLVSQEYQKKMIVSVSGSEVVVNKTLEKIGGSYHENTVNIDS